MSTKKINKTSVQLLILVSTLFILLLTAVNIEIFLTPKKVLGIETQTNTNSLFWEDFLNKNPGYIPGWIEIGRNDIANEIDPNYKLDIDN